MTRRRPIHTVIVSLYAGEPLTPAEKKRLHRYYRAKERFVHVLTAGAWPAARATFVETGTEHEDLEKEILREAETQGAAELRVVVHRLLGLLALADDLQAELTGIKRRLLRQSQRGGQKYADQQQAANTEIRQQLDAIRRQRPNYGMERAIGIYLRDVDEDWPQATETERRQKIRALARRLQRFTKKLAT